MVRCVVLVVAGVVSFAAELGAARLARADEPVAGRDPAKLFADLDQDKDGQLAVDEVPEGQRRLVDRLLSRADKNDDGQLSADEFAAGLRGGVPEADAADDAKQDAKDDAKPGRRERGPRGEPGAMRERMERFRERITQLDANKDGKVELSEVPDDAKPRFESMLDQLDTDGDDAISDEEMKAAAGAMAARFARRPGGPPGEGDGPGNPDGPGGRNRPDGPQGPGGPPRGGLFGMLDKDHDGQLSMAEIDAAAAVLKKMDRDGDGMVDQEELQALAPHGGPGGPPGGPGRFGPGGPDRRPKARPKRPMIDGKGKPGRKPGGAGNNPPPADKPVNPSLP